MGRLMASGGVTETVIPIVGTISRSTFDHSAPKADGLKGLDLLVALPDLKVPGLPSTIKITKPMFAGFTPSKTVNFCLSAVVAGAIGSVVLCPAEDVRIRMVAEPEYAEGTLDCLRKLSAEKGALASFEGFPAMCAKQVPYTMGKQVRLHSTSHLSAHTLSSHTLSSHTLSRWARRSASTSPATACARC